MVQLVKSEWEAERQEVRQMLAGVMKELEVNACNGSSGVQECIKEITSQVVRQRQDMQSLAKEKGELLLKNEKMHRNVRDLKAKLKAMG